MSEIKEKILAGDIRTVARLIRNLDEGLPEAREVLKEIFPHTGRARIIGVTGSPGVGKSTLTDRLVRLLRQEGKTVGVLAVDPTSPFSGGAILGDRVRMQAHANDDGVFIRSMATRGQFGGLTHSTRGAVMVLDAMGKDVVIVETVGVGQDEVDIARTAGTTIIVLAPGLGDDIQAIKAGILEVGDILVVNKADREGADKAVQDLSSMSDISVESGLGLRDWKPPILKTVADRGWGIDVLWTAVKEHQAFLESGQSPYYDNLSRFKARMELVDLVKHLIFEQVQNNLENSGELESWVDELLERRSDPYTISEKIVQEIIR